MVKHMGLLLVLMLLISGCIEAGNLNLPSKDTKIDLSSLSAQLRDTRKTTAAGLDMGVPLKSLPSQYVRSREQGSYSEVFSLKGLPSTTILWTVHSDPFGKEYEKIKAESTDKINLSIESKESIGSVTKKGNLYRIAAHIGLYTFVAQTETPREIDTAKVYGTHEEVVKKVFEAGVKNALSYDLESFGD